MIVIMKQGATRSQIVNVIARLEQQGVQVHLSEGSERTVLGIIGNGRPIDREQLEGMEGVERTVPVLQPFKLASREFHPQDTIVSINGVRVGGKQVVVAAGPGAVEGYESFLDAARIVKEAGAQLLRGGTFQPGAPLSRFQGVIEEELRILAAAREETGLPFVAEVNTPELVPLMATYADVLQIGAQEMQNYALLHAVGETQRPVLLTRGMMSTVEELLMSAEYILSHGNERVMLCERGIRTFEPSTRSTLDINAVPLLKQLSHLPVIVDPSDSTGRWELVGAVAKAAVAAGADGLLVEVHPHSNQTLSEGAQCLTPGSFAQLMKELRTVAQAVGRELLGGDR